MATSRNGELVSELGLHEALGESGLESGLGEGGLEAGFESGLGEGAGEQEGILGAIGNVLGGLFGEAQPETALEAELGQLEGGLGEAGFEQGAFEGAFEQEGSFETEGAFESGMGEGGFGEVGLGEGGFGEGGFGEAGLGEGGFGEAGLGEGGFGETGLGEGGLGESGFGETGLGEAGFELGGGAQENPEQFLGGLLRRAIPVITRLAPRLAPVIGQAIGGQAGGAMVSQLLRLLGQREHESGYAEHEQEYEAAIARPLEEHQLLAESLAAAAAEATGEQEMSALLGAAVIGGLSRRERRALRRVQGHLVAASGLLGSVMRRRRAGTGIRVIPTITRLTARTLTRRAAAGRPVTPAVAAQVMAVHTQRVLGNPRLCGLAVRRNVGATARVRRTYGVSRLPRSRSGRY